MRPTPPHPFPTAQEYKHEVNEAGEGVWVVVFLYKNEYVVDEMQPLRITTLSLSPHLFLCRHVTPNMSFSAKPKAARMPETPANPCNLGAKGGAQSVTYCNKGAETWRTCCVTSVSQPPRFRPSLASFQAQSLCRASLQAVSPTTPTRISPPSSFTTM